MLDKHEAFQRLQLLLHHDLRPLADTYHVTVWKGNKLNKGWAGHVIEHYLGLPPNSSRHPDFGTWELKVVPLKRTVYGTPTVKETMAITMIDAQDVVMKPFEESHLYVKLQQLMVVSRIVENMQETSSCVHAVATFNLDEPIIYEYVKADYDAIRMAIKTKGFRSLHGGMGFLIQPRPKGRGHGSHTRAFYARTRFVAHILSVMPLPMFL